MPHTGRSPDRMAQAGRADADAVPPELSRLRSEAAFHQRLGSLTSAFTRGISSTLSVDRALQAAAAEARGLFGARRVTVWLHDRRARELVLSASSDVETGPPASRVPADDLAALPARILRLERPAVVSAGDAAALGAPLRGWRRALGALLFEGPFTGEFDPLQLIGFAHDLARQISATIENVQLLQEVIEQHRLLDDTFNSILDLVVVTDGSGRIVEANEAFAARVGLPREDLVERSLTALVGHEFAGWIAERPSPAESSYRERTRRFDDERLGGTFSVMLAPLIHQRGDSAGQVMVARDVTRQVQLEREREALAERLAVSEKLASLGQFVAGVAHEMNNPLQGVLGGLELLMRTAQPALPLRRDLKRIYHEADRAARTVRNLLTFSGFRRMTRRRLRVGRLISRAVSSRSRALQQAGIRVVREVAADLPLVAGDPLLLHQALLNVLINAEHAIASTRSGGTIDVRSSAGPAAGRVIITVRDTGPGIAPDILPRVFDPFFTTKEVGKGTGLGLAITYGIVHDHGGTIYAANAPGGGAMFTIELPAVEETHADSAKVPATWNE